MQPTSTDAPEARTNRNLAAVSAILSRKEAEAATDESLGDIPEDAEMNPGVKTADEKGDYKPVNQSNA